ncbi:MAG: hypothetical protein NC251_05065 [Lachnoclostridium sp.]|nr:hypothetical protein [Lachnospira sp.]MCM1247783.1 hypothetical protein [Lachnoclostridium sp.]
MNYRFMTPGTNTVPVYDIAGKKVHEIALPEKIMPLYSKRGGFSETDLYYKGAGIVYQGHLVNQYTQQETAFLRMVNKTNILYEKYQVCYQNLKGRFGIFLFPHQPVFSDLEGGCGRKEKKILENQMHFERTAIEEITNVIPTGLKDHNIFVYKLKERKGEPLDVINLMEYFLCANYNTAWDKNLWADIHCYGYVRDVADWFVSDKLCHKLGTVYALLRSMYDRDVYLYSSVLRNILGIHNSERHFILYFSALIVNKYCPELFLTYEQDVEGVSPELFGRLLKLLFEGKACCHLENDEEWAWVRAYYLARVDRYVKVFASRVADAVCFKGKD